LSVRGDSRPNYPIAPSVFCGKEPVISVTRRPVGRGFENGKKKKREIRGGKNLKKNHNTKIITVDRNKLFERNTDCRAFERRWITIRYYLILTILSLIDSSRWAPSVERRIYIYIANGRTHEPCVGRCACTCCKLCKQTVREQHL